jgi:hypothetical protein
MDSKKYIGMDVHKESISIAVMNGAGKIGMECVIETKASTWKWRMDNSTETNRALAGVLHTNYDR